VNDPILKEYEFHAKKTLHEHQKEMDNLKLKISKLSDELLTIEQNLETRMSHIVESATKRYLELDKVDLTKGEIMYSLEDEEFVYKSYYYD